MENINVLNAALAMELLAAGYRHKLESELAKLKNEIHLTTDFGKGNLRKELEIMRVEYDTLNNFMNEMEKFRERQGLNVGELLPEDIQIEQPNNKWDVIEAEVSDGGNQDS